MDKHTKGPWSLEPGLGGGYTGMVVAPDGLSVAVTCNYKPTERLANARLISASPDLLATSAAAYKLLADITHSWRGRETPEGQMLLISLREAISKATGRDAEAVQDEASCALKS